MTSGLDLDFDEGQQAIHDSVARFCAERVGREPDRAFALHTWRELAELGVLALATPEGEGGAAELVAAFEALGAAAFPGPLAATVLATAVLPPAERVAVASGARLVSVGAPPLMPWAPVADLFLALDGDRVGCATPAGPIAALETLGGEPWGRVALEPAQDLGRRPDALALFELALAAQLAAHGDALLSAATEHARTRIQFGRAIGEFQAVAHPLADARMHLDAARILARAAACAFDSQRDARRTRVLAAAARASARSAALESAHVSHQTFGAQGITLEGPAFRLSRRIRQLASLPPTPSASGAQELLFASIAGAREDPA